MVSLACNLMIRPSEGLRLHFIVNQEAEFFSAIAASSKQPDSPNAARLGTLRPVSYSCRLPKSLCNESSGDL